MAIDRDTDQDWSRIGETEPYFGVLSHPRFMSARLDDDAKEAFFATGRDYVAAILDCLRPVLAGRKIVSALDFGCGVGRLLLPMSRVCDNVAGVDVAPAMRNLATRNVEAAGATNVTVYESIDALPSEAQFDWVNSYIVFQHIPPERGYILLEALLARLRPGGVFSLHFGIARDRALLPASTNRIDLYREEEGGIRPLVATAETSETRMSMFDYDLNALTAVLYRNGVDEFGVRHGVTDGHYSVTLFGRRLHRSRTRPLRSGDALRFGSGGATQLLGKGFGAPEEWGVWTIADTAELDLPISAEGAVLLIFEGTGFTPSGAPAQQITVSVNNRQAAVWQAARGDLQEFRLALESAPEGALRISLAIAAPSAPIDCGEGNDFRRLGFGLRAVRFLSEAHTNI